MENYLGEIRIFGGAFAPVGWEFCDGQLLLISDNDALFSLLNTTYGGDGQTTFALPNMQSRVAVGMGQGQGLSTYAWGQTAGMESVTLTTLQMPAHNHAAQGNIAVSTGGTGQTSPVGALFGDQGGNIYSATAGTATLPNNAIVATLAPAGGSQPHGNVQPVLALRYIIATQGIYPSQA